MYDNKSEPTYSRRDAILGGLAALASGLFYQGCGDKKRKTVFVPVPGQPTNSEPIIANPINNNGSVVVGGIYEALWVVTDDTLVNPLTARFFGGTPVPNASIIDLGETVSNGVRQHLYIGRYTSPANDAPGSRQMTLEVDDGGLKTVVNVVNFTVTAPPATTPPGTTPGTAPGAGGSSGGAGTGNP